MGREQNVHYRYCQTLSSLFRTLSNKPKNRQTLERKSLHYAISTAYKNSNSPSTK